MKKLFLMLLVPIMVYSQSFRGTGGGASVSSMLAIVADSSKWTSGTHVHAIKPRGGKSVQADSAKIGYLNVTGDTQLDGNLTMNTVASESLKVLAGGIRNEGGLIQKGNSSFGLQQTPKSTVQVTGNDISSVNYYKGLRLSNPDAATVGVQALSPALVFRGAGWKTDATAGSDSVLWGIYVLPTQGTAAPGARLYFNKKVGSASWSSPFFIDEFGNGTFTGSVTGKALSDAASTFYISSTTGQSLGGGTQEVILGGRYYSPTDMDYETFATTGTGEKTNIMGWGIDKTFASAPDSVKMVLTATGNLGLGTTTPYSHLSVVDASSGQGTGFHVTSSQWNKARTTWATAHDTSSIAGYIDSAGGPRFSMKAVDGDTLGITLDGTNAKIKTSGAALILDGKSNVALSMNGVAQFLASDIFYPNLDDSKSLGYMESYGNKRFQKGYFSDNLYLGGKDQTATMTIGTQNTMTEKTDSCLVATMLNGNPQLYGMSGYAGQSTRQFYFGPDTLALFNGARTGRDSTTFVLPNGKLVAAQLQVGSSNFTTTKMDTVFTAGYVPRWVKFTSGAKTWYSPVYADTTGKW